MYFFFFKGYSIGNFRPRCARKETIIGIVTVYSSHVRVDSSVEFIDRFEPVGVFFVVVYRGVSIKYFAFLVCF